MTTFAQGFTNGLRVLRAAYPSWDMPAESAQVWGALLSDCDPESLLVAAVQLARESKFPPTPAEWRARALTASGQGRAHAMTPSEAWDELYRNRHRADRSRVRWSSESVRRAAEAVQWSSGDWQSEQLPTIRAQFERYFVALSSKAQDLDASNEAAALLPTLTKSLSAKWNAQLPARGGS